MSKGRVITDHKISELNRRNIKVFATDEADPKDGASHEYAIEVIFDGDTANNVDHVIQRVELKFQHGPLQEAGINGITDQALIAVVLDRLRGFQAGPFSCRDNSIAITKLEEAMLWMGKRYADRAARGVEGKHEK